MLSFSDTFILFQNFDNTKEKETEKWTLPAELWYIKRKIVQ